MKTTQKLIIIGLVLALGVLVGSLMVKPQIVHAQSEYCSSNATQRCVGNSVFWYDSCGKQQSWIKDCFNGCQNGQCINSETSYLKHSKNNCSNGDLYWYDSNGVINDLSKACSDSNSCTQDSCSGSQCLNELKCDSSTCLVGSSDYCSSCNHIGDGVCNCGETISNSPNDCGNINKTDTPSINAIGAPPGIIDVSVFCGAKDNTLNLSKNINVSADEIINCLIVVKNTTTSPVADITIRADIPGEIINTSSLKIDGLEFSGNITSGINIGNFTPNLSKAITFEGKVQSLITQISAKQITGIVSSGNLSSFDTMTINFQSVAVGGTAISEESSPFVNFLKRWYMWILSAVVLVFLFFVIFKRVSSNV